MKHSAFSLIEAFIMLSLIAFISSLPLSKFFTLNARRWMSAPSLPRIIGILFSILYFAIPKKFRRFLTTVLTVICLLHCDGAVLSCKMNSEAQISLSIGCHFRSQSRQIHSANSFAVSDRAQTSAKAILVIHTGRNGHFTKLRTSSG